MSALDNAVFSVMKAIGVHALGAGNMFQGLFKTALQQSKTPFRITTSSENNTIQSVQGLKRQFSSEKVVADTEVFRRDKILSTEADSQSNIYLLGIKPQIFDSKPACDFPDGFTNPDSYVASMMAGKSAKIIQKKLGLNHLPAVFMPNLNAAVSQGVIGYVQSPDFVADPRQAQLEVLLDQSSLVIESIAEDLIWITGVAGSGPAFVMELIKLLEAEIARAKTAEGVFNEPKWAKALALKAVLTYSENKVSTTPLEHKAQIKLQSFLTSELNIRAEGVLDPLLWERLNESIHHYWLGARKGVLMSAESCDLGPSLLRHKPDEAKLNAAILGTMIGSCGRYAQSSEALSVLQAQVRSKGGTTDAGLNVLTARGGEKVPHDDNTTPISVDDVAGAVHAAMRRFIALS